MTDFVISKCVGLLLTLVIPIECLNSVPDDSGDINVTAIPGEYLSLPCGRNSTNDILSQLSWIYNNIAAYYGITRVNNLSRISLQSSNYSLLINGTQLVHTGTYICKNLEQVVARYNVKVKDAFTTQEVNTVTLDQSHDSSTLTNCETLDIVTSIQYKPQRTKGSITCIRTSSQGGDSEENTALSLATTDEPSSFFMVMNGFNVSHGHEIRFESEELIASCYVVGGKPLEKLSFMINNNIVKPLNYSYKSSCVETFGLLFQLHHQPNSSVCLQGRSLLSVPNCITVNFVIVENPSQRIPSRVMAIAIIGLCICAISCGCVLLCLKANIGSLPGRHCDCFEQSAHSISVMSPEIDVYSDAEPTLFTSTEEEVAIDDNRIKSIQRDNVIIESQLPGNGSMKYFLASSSATDKKLIVKSVSDKEDLSFMMGFREMAKQLQILKEHDNIVGVVGIDVVEVPYYIYLEYHGTGTLRNYMLRQYQEKRHSQLSHQMRTQTISLEDEKLTLTGFAVDLLEGMAFLSENKFRHPVLTLAKVLIANSGKCKLYDFVSENLTKEALSRSIKKNCPPLAWLPPEYIFFGQCCEKSDLWSLAVAFWEIFSLGKTPYVGLSRDEIETKIRTHQYLSQPMSCPGSIFSMMLSCWDISPAARPSYYQLRQQLRQIFSTMKESPTVTQSTERTQDLAHYTLEKTPNDNSYM